MDFLLCSLFNSNARSRIVFKPIKQFVILSLLSVYILPLLIYFILKLFGVMNLLSWIELVLYCNKQALSKLIVLTTIFVFMIILNSIMQLNIKRDLIIKAVLFTTIFRPINVLLTHLLNSDLINILYILYTFSMIIFIMKENVEVESYKINIYVVSVFSLLLIFGLIYIRVFN